MRTNPDGSISLDGHFTVTGPINTGVPTPVLMIPPGHGPDDSMRFPAVAWHMFDHQYIPVAFDLNPATEPGSVNGSIVFLMCNQLADGETLDLSVDHVTYWPPG